MNKPGITLRGYQEEVVSGVIASFRDKNHILVKAPCAAGKTECFIEICRRVIEMKPDINILIVLNKVMLVSQTAERIGKIIPEISIYCGSLTKKNLGNVTVASVQSVHKADLEKVNLVILDECHHLSEDDDSYYRKLLKKIEHDRLKVVGFTATPYRPSGYLYGKDKFFDKVDYDIKMTDLISRGYLVKPSLKHTKEEFDTSGLRLVRGEYDLAQLSALTEDAVKANAQVADALPKLVDRKKVAWACTTIKHAEIIQGILGNGAEIIHSKMSKPEQYESRERFQYGESKHMVFVSMLSEGVDVPCIDTIVLLRPTRSPVTYVQVCGRALRLYPGKESALILDYGHVVETLGPLDNPMVTEKGKSRETRPTPMKFCPGCLEYVHASVLVCPICSYAWPARKPKLSTEAEHIRSILSTEPSRYWKNVDRVNFDRYKSRNGNDCLRVSYSENIMLGISGVPFVCDYFVWSSPFARLRAVKLLRAMGVNLSDRLSLVDAVSFLNTTEIVKPIRAVKVEEGKYKKVIDTSSQRMGAQ